MSYLHTPKQNLFLAALPDEVYGRLKSCLELVSLPQGWAVYENGGEIDLVYFPTTSIISLLAITDDGESAKIAVIGNEGLFGIAMLMGRKTTPTRAVVQSEGYGYRLKAANLRREFELGSPLRYLLQRYTQSLTARIAQTAMSSIHPAINAHKGFAASSSRIGA
ncbi:MAG: Crp/Fnr family transcriptional regulator [Nitrosospira sp.]